MAKAWSSEPGPGRARSTDIWEQRRHCLHFRPRWGPLLRCGHADSHLFSRCQFEAGLEAIAGHMRHDATGVAETGLAIEGSEGWLSDGQPFRRPVGFQTACGGSRELKEAVLRRLLRAPPRPDCTPCSGAYYRIGAVLLAGSTGQGKTTLAAVLNARGMSSIADDVALLSVRPPAIGGLPFAFAAKPGSWEILRKWFPALDGAPRISASRWPTGEIHKTGSGSPSRLVSFPQLSSRNFQP